MLNLALNKYYSLQVSKNSDCLYCEIQSQSHLQNSKEVSYSSPVRSVKAKEQAP